MTIQLFGLLITEPSTMLTDYLLGLLTCVLGARLLDKEIAMGYVSRYLWGVGLIFLSVASVMGGTHHGLDLVLDLEASLLLWKITVASIGVGAFLVLAGTSRAYLPSKGFQIVLALGFIKMCAYLYYVLAVDHRFLIVILDYAPNMLLVLALCLWQRKKPPVWQASAKWIAMGVVVSFVAAGIQQSGFDLHIYFNHNDIYHVVQMGGMVLFYLGVRKLKGAQFEKGKSTQDQEPE